MKLIKSLFYGEYNNVHGLGVCLFTAIACALLAFIVFFLTLITGIYVCNGITKATGLATRYEGLQCYVKQDNTYVPSYIVFVKPYNVNVKSENK